jgi:hypothetical protein
MLGLIVLTIRGPKAKPLISSDKFDYRLNSLKPYSDKYGLGFKFVASTSKTHHVTKGKISFVSTLIF